MSGGSKTSGNRVVSVQPTDSATEYAGKMMFWAAVAAFAAMVSMTSAYLSYVAGSPPAVQTAFVICGVTLLALMYAAGTAAAARIIVDTGTER